jgi:hypothetical protein
LFSFLSFSTQLKLAFYCKNNSLNSHLAVPQ